MPLYLGLPFFDKLNILKAVGPGAITGCAEEARELTVRFAGSGQTLGPKKGNVALSLVTQMFNLSPLPCNTQTCLLLLLSLQLPLGRTRPEMGLAFPSWRNALSRDLSGTTAQVSSVIYIYSSV